MKNSIINSMIIFLLFCSFVVVAQDEKRFKVEIEQQVTKDRELEMSFYIQKLQGEDFDIVTANYNVFVSYQYLDIDKVYNVSKTKNEDRSQDPFRIYPLDAGCSQGAGRRFVVLAHFRPQINNKRLDARITVTERRVLIEKLRIPISNANGYNEAVWNLHTTAIINDKRENIAPYGEFIVLQPKMPLSYTLTNLSKTNAQQQQGSLHIKSLSNGTDNMHTIAVEQAKVGASYTLTVYNVIGQPVYQNAFIAEQSNFERQFRLPTQTSERYIVQLRANQDDDIATTQLLQLK